MHAHVSTQVRGHAYIHECTDVCMDACVDMCLGTCRDMRMDMFIDMCIGMFLEMCLDMCIDMCLDLYIDMRINMSVAGELGAAAMARSVRRPHPLGNADDSAMCRCRAAGYMDIPRVSSGHSTTLCGHARVEPWDLPKIR